MESCESKLSFYEEVHTLSFNRVNRGNYIFEIMNNEKEHIWYLFLFACNTESVNQNIFDLKIDFEIVMRNNGSHVAED